MMKMAKKTNYLTNPYFILMVVLTFAMATAQYLLKVGMTNFAFTLQGTILNYKLIIGLGIYGVLAILFMRIIKNIPLSVAYPVMGLSFVWVALLSINFLGETVAISQWIGMATVLVGVGLIGGSASD